MLTFAFYRAPVPGASDRSGDIYGRWRRPGSDLWLPSDFEAVDIYPIRWISWLAAALCIGFGAAFVVVLLVEHVSLYQRILLLAAAAAMPFVARGLLGELRRPKPALRLDRGGVEGAFGRIAWHNVARISVGTRWDWAGYFQPKLILHLNHPVRPAPAARRLWASDWIYSQGRVRGNELQLQLWGRKKRVKNDLARYYRGPIE